MHKRLLTALIAAFMLGSLMLVPQPSFALVSTTQGYQYVVKFICGDADSYDGAGLDLGKNGIADFTPDTGQIIARGEYSTVINIHNPNGRFINMYKKIALDGYRVVTGAFDPQTGAGITFNPPHPRFLYQVAGPIFFVNIVNGTTPPLSPNFPAANVGTPDNGNARFFSLTPKAINLSPDESFQVNCAEIRAVTNDYTLRSEQFRRTVITRSPAPPGAPVPTTGTLCATVTPPLGTNDCGAFRRAYLIKGYFVLFSEAQLDVDAIYTACDEGATPGVPGVVGDAEMDCLANANGVQSFDIQTINQDPVAPPSSLVPPKPVTTTSLTATGRELRIDLGAQSLSAFSDARFQVYDLQGNLLHDSGFVAGTQLSWKMATERPLANGIYLYVISARDVFGRVGYHVGKFALLR